jgi:hypothetical protein
LKRKGFLLLGGGTMKNVVMLFSLDRQTKNNEVLRSHSVRKV